MLSSRPVLIRKTRLHVGQRTVGAKLADEAALTFRAARLLCAAVMRLLSADLAPVLTAVRHAGRSAAYQWSVLITHLRADCNDCTLRDSLNVFYYSRDRVD